MGDYLFSQLRQKLDIVSVDIRTDFYAHTSFKCHGDVRSNTS